MNLLPKLEVIWILRKVKLLTEEILHISMKNSTWQPSSGLGVPVVFDTVTQRMFTNDLKYGNHLEIVFSNDAQCYIVKDLNNIKSRWLKKHGKSTKDVDRSVEKFLKER